MTTTTTTTSTELCSKQQQRRQRRRPSMKRKLTAITTALVVSCFLTSSSSSMTCVSAFGNTASIMTSASTSGSSSSSSTGTGPASSSSSSISTTTQVFYSRDHHDDDIHDTIHADFDPLFFQQTHQQQQRNQQLHLDENSAFMLSSSASSSMPASPTKPKGTMPTWLRLSKAHLVHENMERLRDAMLSSIFTETEVLKLTYAIQESSDGNANKMAGAAEFCLIMVETMEMGLNALIAGAFHYCSCVNAREKTLLPAYAEAENPLAPWEFRPHQGMESFGEHAMQIERDAARLKRLEVVASMVVQNRNTHAAAATTTLTTSTTTTTTTTSVTNAAANLRNLYMTEAHDWRALAIRGAACLYRLRGIIKSMSPAHKLTRESNRVCREALRIYAPLASRLGMHRLKNELEHAAFRILYKRQHQTVESLLHQTRVPPKSSAAHQNQNERGRRVVARMQPHQSQSAWLHQKENIGESMQNILNQVQDEMTEILKNDAVFSSSVSDFVVTARVKEGYSTWRKMLRKGLDHILQVPDALALRVVLNAKKDWDGESASVTRARERALCYYAQQLCMSVWKPDAENPRFRDYIAKPKENGYQSLHYTATTPWNGEDWTMEIQVRSGEMHKVAEYGLASHWNYKATAKPPKTNTIGETLSTSASPFGKVMASHNSDAYLRSLQEWHWHQHGSPIIQEPLVLFDEVESQERAERIRARTQRLAPYIEALANAKSDLQRESVFVFLSPHDHGEEGMVVALPAGAVVLDAIRQCEMADEVVTCKESVTHNGLPAKLTAPLQNGDVLSIPAASPCMSTA